MRTFNVRAMVEGAILAALTVIMGVFYRVPVLELLTFFWPVPMILVGYRHGFKVSIISAVVAALILSLLVNPVVALVLLLVYALPGAVIGMMLHRKLSPYAAILAGGITLGFTAVLEFALMIHILFNKNVIEVLFNFGAEVNKYYSYLYSMIEQTSSVYTSLGIDKEMLQQALELYKDALSNVNIILPAGLLLAGIIISYANFKVARTILSRIGYYIEDIKPFSRWRIKDTLIAPVLLLSLLVILLNYLKIGWLQNISTNLLLVLIVTYTILGLSVLAYFVQRAGAKYEIPKALLGFITVFLFMVLYAVLPFIGMFDLTADIRRLNKNTIGGVK